MPGAWIGFGGTGMKTIQAVDIGDLNTVMPQHGSDCEKTHGFGPEIVGSKIMDPGIDQQNMGCIAERHILSVIFIRGEIYHRGFFQFSATEKQGVFSN